jgi:RHS repeat-associated protein
MAVRLKWLWVVGLMILNGLCSQAQQNATGTQSFGSFSGGPDTINLGNLDVNLVIPILQRQGRGIPFVFDLTYDSSLVWLPMTSGGTTTWTPQSGWGWPASTSAVGYVPSPTVYQITTVCRTVPTTTYLTTTNRIYSGYADLHGTLHHAPGLSTVTLTGDSYCTGTGGTNGSATTDDGSGYKIAISYGTTVNTATITTKKGATFTAPIGAGIASVAQDSNGNKITVNSSTGQFYDTLSSSTPVLTVTGIVPSPVNYQYTAPGSGGTGTSVSVVVSYKPYPVETNFSCSGVTDYGVSSPINNNLVDKITYPDGSFYKFTYELTPGHSANVTGRIASVTFPTGGTISYTYTGSNGGINCADGTTMGFKRYTPDSGSGYWQYSRSGTSPNWTTTVTDPLGNVTTYTMYEVVSTTTLGSTSQSTYTYYEQNRTVGSLETILTCYNAVYSGCTTAALTLPISQIDQYVTLGAQTSATETKFDTGYGGRVTEVKNYDFGVTTGSAPASTVLKDTTITYVGLTGILDHPYQVTVKDGSGTVLAQTTFTYDVGGVTTTSAPQHVAPTGSRGNATTVSSWTSGTSTLSKNFSYFDTGNVYTATGVNSAVTTYHYGACGSSMVTEIDLPLSLTEYFGWDNSNSCIGAAMTSAKDVNGNTTTYKFTDPYYWRLAEADYPDGGSTKYAYTTSSPPWSTATTFKQTSTANITTNTVLDGLGRTSQTQLTSDPSGTDYVDTTYDALGRMASVSNPYRTTSDPTYGITQYTYDALNRPTKITNPDGNYGSVLYTSRAARFTDPSGIQRSAQIDGLGRTVLTCTGVGAGNQANNQYGYGAPSACGLDVSESNGFPATIAYDPLGNITSMSFSGEVRSYTYDGLSRMLTETVPEIPTVGSGTCSGFSKCYAYDTGSGGDLYTMTFLNPAGTSVNAQYAWDSLHRLNTLHYSDGSNGYGYTYDASTWLTWNLNNGKGRLTSESHSNGAASAHSYDAMGRPVWEGSCAGANCYSTVRGFLHAYDYTGNVIAVTDSYTGQITKTRNTAGQVTAITSAWSDTTHPGTLLSGVTYNALGEVVGATYGDGLVKQNWYDTNGRLTQSEDGTYPGKFHLYLTYNPNSTISEYQDDVTGRWDYTYDAFNRLATANLTQTGNNSPPHYSYSYDQFGNRWQQHLVSGTGSEVDYTYDTTAPYTTASHNHNSNFTYDSAGNVTADGLCSPTPCWSFDDAGQLTAGNGASYLYDALGRRQQKTDAGGTVRSFVFDGNSPFTEYSPGFTRATGGFFTYANGTTYFNRTDNLGTPRLSTDYTGAVQRTEGVLMGPFGDDFTESLSTLDFTGYAGGFWDSENNGDHFGAREYQKTHGSWLSPDPAGLAAVNPWDPQTWNRYAYVGNNPVTYNDPSGLQKGLCGSPENRQCASGDPSQPYGPWFGLGWNPFNIWLTSECRESCFSWFLPGGGGYLFNIWNWYGSGGSGNSSCAVIGAGVNDNPGNPDFAQAANQYGAITAFPYGGESGPAGFASVAFQSAGFANSSTAVLANAINSAAASNDSLTLYLYSGSAQAFTTAVENGMISPTAVDAIQQIFFLSPGTGDVAPTTMGLPDSAVQTFWGNQGIQDNLVWMLNGSSMSAPSTLLPCGHSFACEFNSPQVPKPRGRCAGH